MVGIDWSAPLELMDGTPVSAERDDDGDYRVTRVDEDGFTGAQVGEWAGTPTFFANANGCHWLSGNDGIVCIRNSAEHVAGKRLRDAAPDLLEALQWALAELNGKTRYDECVADHQIENCYARAQDAIAKAIGQ